MIKDWQSHKEYLKFIKHRKTKLDSSQRLRWHDLRPIRKRIKSLNLDPAGEYLKNLYSCTGRPAVNQAQILRSFVLFFILARNGLVPLSLTKWVAILKGDSLYSILIGCRPGSSPPLGSYYGFMDRLWAAPHSGRYSRNKTFPSNKNKSKPKMPKCKGEKSPDKKPKATRQIADRFISGKDGHTNFERFLQDLFHLLAVVPSSACGLIPKKNLTVSGDGTSVHAHASPYGRTPAQPGDCHARHFSDPDAGWGWDSDLEKYYFGYTLYHLSFYNSTVKTDIPLCLRFFSARRHDSISFLITYQELKKHSGGINIRNMCLDSAHDNYPTYELLINDGVRPFIDLNSSRGRPETLPAELMTDADGTPICQAGHRMVYWGRCDGRQRMKWRCPSVLGRCDACPSPCSQSPYGRVIYTKPSWDIRLFTPVPRGTPDYTAIYKNRTCSERINNRILNDYGLHSIIVHTVKRYSFMATIIGICIHLDARYKQSQLSHKAS